MEALISRTGPITIPPPKGDFETLVDAIVSQQLSIKAAATIFGRVVHLLENEVTPGTILSTPPEALRAAGLSGQKTSYMYARAEAFAKNPERYSHLHEMNDTEVIKSLTAIKGIGVWTAQMFLIFTLLREDVFPIDDLGIRRGMLNHITPHLAGSSFPERELKKMMEAHAEKWQPYRSVASLYLWKGVDG
jgi:DNA-3-methyladenine glycosylase II